jgi:2-polyprenyl-3-methyl-5-hydroxy-6-metoxy-1,4-benzoquinol methylase
MWPISKGGSNMNIRERILFFLSRVPSDNDYSSGDGETTIDKAPNLLTRVYPNFDAMVSGKRVVDFGCGLGYQIIVLVRKFGCSVIGIDSNRRTLEKATENS